MNEVMLSNIQDHCPYCGSPLELAIDTTAGNQDYFEDCDTCCAPINILIELNLEGQLIEVQLKRDSD